MRLDTLRLGSPRLWLTLLGIAFVLAAAWSLRYFSRYQPLTSLAQTYIQPGLGQIGLEAHGVRAVGHVGGHRRWRVSARTLTFSRDRRVLSADGVTQGLLYNAQGRPAASLAADHATYQTPFGTLDTAVAGTLQISGSVRAVMLGPQRPVLQTQGLVWDTFRSQVSSPGPATVTLPRLSVAAGGAAYDIPGGVGNAARGTLRLSGGVRALVRSPRGRLTLVCPGLTWDAAASAAHSLGPVTAQIPGNIGSVTAADVTVDTKTGGLTGHGFQGTARVAE